MRVLPLVILFLIASSGTAAASEIRWTVERGDTLSGIALRHEVSVADLRSWNGLESDVIRVGQVLKVRAPGKPYRVAKGDTLSRIAARAGVSVADIVAYNPGLDPNRIRVGQTIQLPVAVAPEAPGPVKTPLECPGRVVQIAKHEGYRLRSEDFAWATAQTADALARGFSFVHLRHRNAPRVRVLDASRREGGPLGEHRSHRDGRDVDITYFQPRCASSGCPLESVTPSALDVARQWTLIQYWLDNDDVEFLFIDWGLQKVLYEHAQRIGVSQDKLEAWFQYPRPPGTHPGVIHHWEGHRNHLHVRFKRASCPGGCCRAPESEPRR